MFTRPLTLTALAALALAASGAAHAAPRYTAFVGNDQCPTNNSVSKVTGSATTWTLGAAVGVGSCPAGIAFSVDGTKAWVMNAGDNSITPINATTFAAGTPFSSGVSAPLFVAATSDGQSLITGGAGSNQLAIISTADTADIKIVPVGNSPLGVAVLSDNSEAFVATAGDGTVGIVKLGASPALVKTVTFPAPGCAAYGLAALPDGTAVYAACESGALWKIVTKTGKAARTPIAIPQASGGAEVAITPNGKTAYVSNTNGFVYPVTLKTGAVGAGIPIAYAYGLAISPDGKILMVGNGNCCFIDTPISIVSVATNSVTSTIETGGNYTHRWLAFKP